MIRNKTALKSLSLTLILIFLVQVLFPSAALALTGGPSQPEVESFEPIGTNQMVDPFTGDFTYNIPLLDVGGYPVNISYHSGITMDQEASWVGLGWNINPGTVNRNLRGLPDDFKGDEVRREFNMKDNTTVGVTGDFNLEIFGFDPKKAGFNANLGLGINYNSYNGIGIDISGGINASLNKASGESGTAGLGLSFVSSSNNGLTVSPSLSYSQKMEGSKLGALGYEEMSGTVGVSVNSRAGLTGMNVGVSAKRTIEREKTVNGTTTTEKITKSGGTFSGISFIPATYLPQQKFPFESKNISASLKLGAEVVGNTASFALSGYYSSQKLKSHLMHSPAYGYLYAEDGISDSKSLLDFNREKDRPFTRHTPNLPLTNQTFDLFGISGQGIDGMFRAHRSEVAYVRDPFVKNTSASYSLGVELGVGGIVKFGADATINEVLSKSGGWSERNDAITHLAYQNELPNDLYEGSYFKRIGEPTPDLGVEDEEYWKSALYADEPLQIKIAGDGYSRYAASKYRKKSKQEFDMSQVKRTARDKRNQVISSLTKEEVGQGMGLDSYVSDHAEDHHIGELTVLKTDGSRYVYGVPAYNFFQRESTFNVSGNSGKDCTTGLINYGGTDDGKGNKKGIDNFYESTETPPYAHSYLISAVLSADYSDMDGEKGPSLGDYGNYVKFEYDKIDNYDWRVPYTSGKASLSEGLKSLASDDMGHYIYGEKELFYLETMESRTHIAVFHKSIRADGYGAEPLQGGFGPSAASLKLDSISLYTMADYISYDGDVLQMVPLKRVHFEYDYSLCPGVPNNEDNDLAAGVDDYGKLTLKKIFFTYGKSHKARFIPYQFNYADPDHDGVINPEYNPSYNLKGYDRWGSYKPNDQGSCSHSGPISTAEYPYTEQDEALTDVYSQAWSLTSIHLPSGGKMKIDYESDDYAYVQDRPAMQMFKVAGIGEGTSFNPAFPQNNLYDGNNPHEFIYFQLQEPVSTSTSVADFKEQYLKDIIGNKLYFRCLTNLRTRNIDGNYDYVSGYLDVIDAGFAHSSGGFYDYAYVKVKSVGPGDKEDETKNAHPISVAAWNFARSHNPEAAFGSGNKHLHTDPGSLGNFGEAAEDVFYELIDAFENFYEIFRGPNTYMRDKGYAKEISLNKSWVRLHNPNGHKLGGGSRVQKIVVSDNWSGMTDSGQDSEYGQVYNYDLEDGTSSGVAAYEPLIGGDENPFRTPVSFSEERLLVPDREHYMETPFGESFFPAPSVGYSRVTVQNIQYTNVTQNATGKVVHEFYTAKDFPTLTDFTDLQPGHKPASFLSRMLKFSVRDHMNTSQGYVVETNDMHGKPKAQYIYAQGQDNYTSGVEYKYQYGFKRSTSQVPDGTTRVPLRKVLDNDVQLFFKDNRIDTREIGVDYDMVNDFKMSETKSTSGGANFNMSTIFAIIVLPIPTIIPSLSKQTTLYRSAVTTKVVNRFAVPSSTIAYDLGSTVETENLLRDAETGEVILTKTTNNFDDPVYNLTLPAHLAYDRMGGAYRNIGYEEDISVSPTGKFSDPSASDLVPGDEVKVTLGDGSVQKGWVVLAAEGDPLEDYLFLIDEDGAPFAQNTYRVKVIRSGRRNMIMNSMQQVVLKQDPRKLVNGTLTLDLHKVTGYDPEIISASATEYNENHKTARQPYDLETHKPFSLKKVAYAYPNPNDLGDDDVRDDLFQATFRFLNRLAALDFFDFSQVGYPNKPAIPLWHLVDGSTFTQQDMDLILDHLEKPIPLGVTPYVGTTVDGGDGTHSAEIVAFIMGQNQTYYSRKNRFRFRSLDMNYPSPPWYSLNPVKIESFDISTALIPDPNVPTVGITGKPSSSNPNGIEFHYTKANDATSYTGYITPTINLTMPYKCGYYVWERACPTENYKAELDEDELHINPLLLGIRGNWYPYEGYAYLSDRQYNGNSRKDGAYSNFKSFWGYNSVTEEWESDPVNWTSSNTLSLYDEYGNEVENKDALDRSSAALFGFNGSVPAAVGQNTQWGQLAYDSFDQYLYTNSDCKRGYFAPYPKAGDDDARFTISSTDAHTGLSSARLAGADGVLAYELLFDFTEEDCANPSSPDQVPFVCGPCDVMGTFGQYELRKNSLGVGIGDSLIVSYWIKKEGTDLSVTDYNDPIEAELVRSGSTVSLPLLYTSPVIDGWQKIERRLEPGTTTYSADLEFRNTTSDAYLIDDIRIYPDYGLMKSYCYNPNTMRLMAELDENNYATFYEYDEEGKLIRVKKETERGIVTIQEHHGHNPKQ